MKCFTAAVVQLDSQSDKQKNLEQIEQYITKAIQKGARLLLLPEVSNYVGGDCISAAESIPEGETYRLVSELAAKYKVWIHGGSIYEINKVDQNRPYNSSFLVGPDGTLAGKYRKIHLADMKFSDAVLESDTISAGSQIVTVQTEDVGTLGLSICYDIRFGELYRLLTLKGAQILVVPACFYMETGKDHWETLLRARAIENCCYVLAAGQIGTKQMGNNIFKTYGKSMIIDPWGDVIAKVSDHSGIAVAEIDLEYVQAMRNKTCTLDNRREDGVLDAHALNQGGNG